MYAPVLFIDMCSYSMGQFTRHLVFTSTPGVERRYSTQVVLVLPTLAAICSGVSPFWSGTTLCVQCTHVRAIELGSPRVHVIYYGKGDGGDAS